MNSTHPGVLAPRLSLDERGSNHRGTGPDDEVIVVCIGTIEERYGHHTLVDAVASARHKLPGLRVTVTGEGTWSDELSRRIADQGLEPHLRFAGWLPIEELRDLLDRADIGVIAQLSSPYSNLVHTGKMYEYLAFGIPVVASRLTSVNRYFPDDVIRYFEAGDADDLADALVELADDPASRRERGGRDAGVCALFVGSSGEAIPGRAAQGHASMSTPVTVPRPLAIAVALVILALAAALAIVLVTGDDDSPMATTATTSASSEEAIPDTTATIPDDVLTPTVRAENPLAGGGNPAQVRVQGNQLVDETGAPYRLIGVNRSGTEYSCIKGEGFHDGGSDANTVAAMAEWGVNTVRVLLNEHCWLGLGDVPGEFGGQAYQEAIVDWVHTLHTQDMVVIIALIWSAPGERIARDQERMANTDYSPAFWRSVATVFKDDPSVLFELYGEPHDVSWECLRDGCEESGGLTVAGMQQLLDSVRSTGATQPVLVNGIIYANGISELENYLPTDPLGQLAIGFHVYDFNICIDEECWDRDVASIAQIYPVITTEVGQAYCGADFLIRYMEWADAHGISYLGWTWNAWGECARGTDNQPFAGSDLIVDEDGTPTEPQGAAFRDHILALGARDGR